MHKNLPRFYHFINQFDKNHIRKLDKKIFIIYRDYKSSIDIKLIIKIRDFCRKNKRKLFLSNNIKLALKLGLDGAYIPSFNKNYKHLSYKIKNNFSIIGSAHNLKEIRIKELQNAGKIFISSIFKKEKNYLGFYKFKILSSFSKKKIIALGGINKKNIKKINLLNIDGFAGISMYNQ